MAKMYVIVGSILLMRIDTRHLVSREDPHEKENNIEPNPAVRNDVRGL